MTSRDLTISLKSKWDDAGFTTATASAKAFATELARMERAAAKQRDAMESAGRTVAGFGAATVAGVSLAVKAAIDWESAWTGVMKTVDGTPAQMGALEESLRGLARELPITHTEIAGVAEAAGQLGVKRQDILGFTETMLKLGMTTDMSAEQAATALAKFSNIMGTSSQDIGKLGSALVALGNNGASTESEITDMALRIAGAGKQIGLSEADVLGFASALSSMGIEAEAGGSSISRVMVSIAQAVDGGGEKLNTFAKVAGMSADQFSTAFKDDAAGAIASFIEGLGHVEESGGSVFATLQQLGIVDTEVRDTLLRTAGAGDLLSQSLRLGKQAWTDNNALQQEAAARLGTTASAMQVAQNQIVDMAITIGQNFLPAVGAVAQHLGGWVELFGELPGPVKTAVSALGGLAGIATLVAGAFVLGVPKIAEFRESLDSMGPRAQKFGSAISAVGNVLMGPLGIALGVATIGVGIFAEAKAAAAAEVRDFTDAIRADGGAIAENTRVMAIKKLSDEGLLVMAKRLGVDTGLFTDAVLGNKTAIADVTKELHENANALTAVGGRGANTSTQWRTLSLDAQELMKAISGKNETISDSIEAYRAEEEALGGSSDATDKQAKATKDAETYLKAATDAAKAQAPTLGNLTGAVKELAAAYGLAGDDATAAVQQMLDGWSQAFSQFGSLSGALQSAEESASQTTVSTVDRQAEAKERLAEVQRSTAEKIKSAQKELASAHQQAADDAVEAQGRIADAQASLVEAEQQAADKVADAQEKVADAQRHAADVAEDSGRKVEQAAQRVADAQADAADREMDAERRRQDAYARTQEAIEDLTDARERAAERIDELNRSQAGNALDVEGAEIAIQRARERLDEVNADPEASALDRQEADLAYRRALQRLDEIKQHNADLAQEIAEANAAGVEGSTEVIDAKKRIAEAQAAEQEAEANLAKQREDSARSVADAEQSLADARDDAAKQQEDAQRDLAKAEDDVNRARIEGAKDVLKAKKDVADAEKEAKDAAKDAAAEIKEAEESVKQAKQDSAREIVKANNDVKDSWSSVGSTAAVTTEQLLREMEKQVKAQEKWADDLISLAGRVPDEMLAELAALGPGGAKVVALAADMSKPELDKFVELHGRSGKLAGDEFAQNLGDAGPALRDIAKTRGQEIADKVREGMDGGRLTVAEAARRIGVEIDNGIGKDRTVTVTVKTDYQDDLSRAALRAAVGMADGGILAGFADGGIATYADGGETHVAQISHGLTRVWSEPETGGEAYIPLAYSKRDRSEDILSEVAERFGGHFYRTMPVSGMHASPSSGGGMYHSAPVYNITVNGGLDAGAEIGRRVVGAIQEYERGSGTAWRRDR